MSAGSSPNRFDTDTAVVPMPGAAGVFEARIDRGWWIVDGPNGGYLAAILLRALSLAVADPARAPRSLTVHYTRRPSAGPVAIETTVERAGRALTTVSARMLQEGKLLAVALAAFSAPRASAISLAQARMPEVPPPGSSPRLPDPGRHIEIRTRYDTRHALGPAPFSGGAEAQTGGWIRLAEPRIADAPLVAAFSDAWPPAVFGVAPPGAEIGPVPTIDLTVHFRSALPLPDARSDDFHLCVFRTRALHDGFLEEDGEIWSPGGVLVAQSRQLAIAGR